MRSGLFLCELRGFLRADFFFEVAAIHVRHFVREDSGKFGFVMQIGKRATRYENVAARQ